ncbi:MAG: tRNA pseudouridine(55) synthase TruB, partial [Prochlorococcus sp. TMED223]
MTVPFGFVVIDKPAGLTSHDCVSRMRRVFGIKRVGHGGTLDPAVTGVLPIALGHATRLLPYLPGA